jgi:hypothetical protein
MAKYEITEKGCNGLEIGDTVEVKGDNMPGWLVGKAVEIKTRKAKAAVVNPAENGGETPKADDKTAPKAD